MYDHILVYCNAKRGADASVRHAIDLAASVDARLSFLYLTQLSGGQIDRATHTEDKVDGVGPDADVEDEIRALAEEAGVGYDVLAEQERSGSTISAIAEREGADVIVVGSVGKTVLERILEGSIANDVVQSATQPVLTIRLDEEDVRGIGVYECKNCGSALESTAEEMAKVQCPYCGSEDLLNRTLR